jgi:putative acetyltransferase
MSVHDDFQGRGVGTALMAALIELADNWLGLRRVELEVWTDNVAAIHLYQKFGFEIEGTAHAFAWRAGALVDAHYMARLRR